MTKKEEKQEEQIQIKLDDETAKLVQIREELYTSIAVSLRHTFEDMGKLKDIDNKIIVSLSSKESDK